MGYQKVNVNINGTVYNKERIRAICKIRTEDGLPCRNCVFEGSVCEDIKAKYNIDKPKDYWRGMPVKEENYGNKQKRKGS